MKDNVVKDNVVEEKEQEKYKEKINCIKKEEKEVENKRMRLKEGDVIFSFYYMRSDNYLLIIVLVVDRSIVLVLMFVVDKVVLDIK